MDSLNIHNFVYNEIINGIKSESSVSIPQCYYVVGRRGYGKTGLLRSIERNLKDVATYMVLYVDCLMSPLFSIEETINKYYGQKKRLLLLLDDMDIVLANMERTEQFRLRSLLYREGAPIIIGTGTELANDLIDYQAPFYDAFILFHLKELSQDVAIELLNKMRVKSNFHKIDTSSEIVSFIFDEIGRTPENCRILANIPHLNAKRDIILRKALKPLSLYYRDKIMNLSPSQRKTLIFMLSEKRPVLLKEIREGTNQSAGDISPQLKALSNKGLISTIKQRAKKTEYSITDKLMVLWYKNCIEKDTLCAAIDKL